MKISKQLKNRILQSAGMLTENECALLRACAMLCTEGVSLSSLRDIIGVKDSDAFWKELKAIMKAGLIEERANVVYCPEKVAWLLSDRPLPDVVVNAFVAWLKDKTTLRVDDDLLVKRECFTMADKVIGYVLKHPANICMEDFATLTTNYMRHYDIYAIPDPTIRTNADLKMMKAIKLCKGAIDKQSLLYARLLTCEAYIHLCGFWYDPAKRLLDEAIAIESKCDDNKTEMAFTYYVMGLYYGNYFVPALQMEYLYKARETTRDEVLRQYVDTLIAFELANIGQYDLAASWMEKSACLTSAPRFCTARIFDEMINALRLRASSEEEAVAHYLKGEWMIDTINSQAPIKVIAHRVMNTIYTACGLLREADKEYLNYATILGRHFASSDGAMFIHSTGEAFRLTLSGALSSASQLIKDKLDRLQITHPGFALSVKIEACLAYVYHYGAIGCYPLAETYYKMGLEFVGQITPSAETLEVLGGIFGDNIPPEITGEGLRWTFEYSHLNKMVARKDIAVSEKTEQINKLKIQFPSRWAVLDVVEASLKDAYPAVRAWHRILATTEQERRYDIALLCACTAIRKGLIWEGAEFYSIALHTDGYKKQNKFKRIDLLVEVAMNQEDVVAQREARMMWEQLEEMAQGTGKLADVYQARGNCLHNQRLYKEALEYYDKFLAVYVPEEGLTDQRLTSIYTYMCSCYGALGDYHAAYASSVAAKRYSPMSGYDAFNLEFNHGFFAMTIKKYKVARESLLRAKALAQTEDERNSVDNQLAILAMKKEDREALLKEIIFNFDA